MLMKAHKPLGLAFNTTLQWCTKTLIALRKVRTLYISLVKDIEQDYEQSTLVGIIFGPIPSIEVPRAWITTNWEPKGIKVSISEGVRNNSYIFLMKTPEMTLQAISTGEWVIRNSPLSLFKWFPYFKPEGGNQVKYPVWVELPDLSFQYYTILKSLDEPLGKVWGFIPVNNINPRWHWSCPMTYPNPGK